MASAPKTWTPYWIPDLQTAISVVSSNSGDGAFKMVTEKLEYGRVNLDNPTTVVEHAAAQASQKVQKLWFLFLKYPILAPCNQLFRCS